MANEKPGDPGVDKNFLYGRYQKQEDRRNDLATKMAHKALDIPETDMQINANRTGLGPLGAIGVALAGALPAAALAAFLSLRGSPAAPAPTPAPLADREYDVRFYDRDGHLIDIPPISAKGKDAAP